MRKSIALMFLVVALIAGQVAADDIIPGYYSHYDFLMAPSTVFDDGLLGFVNPANSAFLKNPEMRFHWQTDGPDALTSRNWGLFMSGPNLGFGVLRQKEAGLHSTNYRLSLAGGDGGGAIGIAYSWTGSNISAARPERLIGLGLVSRPMPYLSIGLTGNFSVESHARQAIGEIGIRPLATPIITLFADTEVREKSQLSNVNWSAGGIFEFGRGINLIGRYFDTETFSLGLSIEFGDGGMASQMNFDNDQKYAYSTYSLRSGGPRQSIFPELAEKEKKYVKISLKGTVGYQKYRLFDDGTIRFMDVLRDIKAAADDPRVAVIALNLSSMRVYSEHAWEIREQLKYAKSQGKTIIAFIENAGMSTYHLASVADRIVMDPQGLLELKGYALTRTYLKGSLDKLGLAFDEWRFFKYKSAAETLTRTNMSDADREQYQAYLDDYYESVRAEICEGRSFTKQKYDNLIDNQALFMPEQALEIGLIDTLARWSDAAAVIKNIAGRSLRPQPRAELFANALPPRNWGKLPVVAVVYGLGECAMDTGIRARWLERVFKGLENDRSVKAVVFRVDSPGGDGMASDLVAEALKKCAAKKPVIVSQGQVAGSGGYWISMYGNKILAGPNTITGSIGVIGGWLYDNGFSSKLGLSSDKVYRGKHADIESGVRLPILGMTVPARNLTAEERSRVEKLIIGSYDIFVGKVADGRHMSVDEVNKIAQGHFYSGLDGKELGLVDEIGGLMLAIDIARDQAGIYGDYELREIPKYRGLFKFENPMPEFMGTHAEIDTDPLVKYIKMLNDHNGRPLPMLLPGTYPDEPGD